jgi:hypothetical protein
MSSAKFWLMINQLVPVSAAKAVESGHIITLLFLSAAS